MPRLLATAASRRRSVGLLGPAGAASAGGGVGGWGEGGKERRVR